MKYPRAVLALMLVLALAVAGCGAPASSRTAEPTPSPSVTAAVSNPLVAASAASLLAMGLPLAAPASATNVVRYIINENVAELFFDYNSVTYSYRASSAVADAARLAGLSEELPAYGELSVDVNSDTLVSTVDIYLPESGGALGTWQIGDAAFTLYTIYRVSAEAMGELCLALISAFADAVYSAEQGAITLQDLIDELGIYIDAPSGAVSVSRSIYEQSVARVNFTYEECSFVFSAQSYPGVPSMGEFLHTEQVEVQSAWGLDTMQLSYNDGADAAISWSHDNVNYCLYCKSKISTASLCALALQLAGEAHARTEPAA